MVVTSVQSRVSSFVTCLRYWYGALLELWLLNLEKTALNASSFPKY